MDQPERSVPDLSEDEARRLTSFLGPVISAVQVPDGYEGEYIPSREEIVAGIVESPDLRHLGGMTAADLVNDLLSEWRPQAGD
jgi:hypothetical protein